MTKNLAVLWFFIFLFNHSNVAAQSQQVKESSEIACYLDGLSDLSKAQKLAAYFDSAKEKFVFYKIDMQRQTLYLRYAHISKEEAVQCIETQFPGRVTESSKFSFEKLAELENPAESGIILNKQK